MAGFFSFLKKKEEEPKFDFNLGLNEPIQKAELGPKEPAPSFSYSPQPTPPPLEPVQSFQDLKQNDSSKMNRDLELISAKLDTIKAMIETLSQRISHLEKQQPPERERIRW